MQTKFALLIKVEASSREAALEQLQDRLEGLKVSDLAHNPKALKEVTRGKYEIIVYEN